MTTGPKPRPVADRIRERVTVDAAGCWVWQGYVDPRRGYGQMRVGSRTDDTARKVDTHRASYEAHVGPVPAGLELDHLCRNRACCNPDHLEPVTRRENQLRGNTIAARNVAKVRCTACGGEYTTRHAPSRPRPDRVCRACDIRRAREQTARKQQRKVSR